MSTTETESPISLSSSTADSVMGNSNLSLSAIPPTPQLSRREVGHRLTAYLRPYWGRIVLGLLCGTIAGVAQAAVGGLIKQFFDSLIDKTVDAANSTSYLGKVCFSVVGLYALLGILKYAQSVLLSTVAQKAGLQIRHDVYSHLQQLSLSYFHRRRTGALMSVLTNDINKLQSSATMLKDVVATPIQALVYLVVMVYVSWQLSLFSVVALPLVALVVQRLTRRMRSISRQAQERMADVSAIMEETLAAPRVVRAFTAEAHEVARFDEQNRAAVGMQLKGMRRSARLGPMVDLIGSVGIALILFVGGREVLAQHMTPGSLTAFAYFASQLANAANGISSLRGGIEEVMGAADRIFGDVLDVVPDVRDAPEATPLPSVIGRIEFQDVSFEYEPGKRALQHVSLTVEPGEVVALVGETGAGKTTLADMVPRFYDPTAGALLIDGRDVRTATLKSLRSQIGIVPQDTLLFSGTIRDNIVYGRRDALDTEVVEAANAANAASFIESLPEKYSTRIGERGHTLSGGERQRIAIARALLADPRILILDEATSALDAATEALVQEALETLMKGRTTIIIAHRLSTIINADKIVVLRRGGQIAEMGSHAGLMARGGVYAALFEAQQRSAELTPAFPEP